MFEDYLDANFHQETETMPKCSYTQVLYMLKVLYHQKAVEGTDKHFWHS